MDLSAVRTNLSPAPSNADDLSLLGAAFSPPRSRGAAAGQQPPRDPRGDDEWGDDGLSQTASSTQPLSPAQLIEAPFGAPPSNERVLQTFMRELQVAPPFLQRLHLRLFSERFDAFLARVAADEALVHDTDVEGLLLHLLLLAHRRGGLTPLQQHINNECSDAAFSMLFGLTVRLHPASYRTRRAWVSLLTAVGIDRETITEGLAARRVDAGPADNSTFDELDAAARHEATAIETEAAAAHAEEAHQLAAVRKVAPDVAALGASTKFSYDPYWYSLDCLPTYYTGGLTELEYQAVETWFSALDFIGGKYAVTAGCTTHDNVLGGIRVLSRQALNDWVRMFPDGTATIADVLTFLFPTCSVAVIQQRIEGTCLGLLFGLFIDDAEPDTPDDVTTLCRAPAAQEAGELLKQSSFARPDAQRTMLLARRIFDAADEPKRSGQVTLSAIRAVLGMASTDSESVTIGRFDLGAPFEVAARSRVARDGQRPSLSYEAWVRSVVEVDAASADAIARGLEEVERASKWQQRDTAYYTRKRTAEIDACIAKYSAKAQQKKLTIAQRVTLRERHVALVAAVERTHVILRRRAMREADTANRLREIHEQRRRIAETQDAYSRKNVLPVYGPEERPTHCRHPSGVEFNSKLFDFTAHLEDEARRADVIALLKAFDRLGLHPQCFVAPRRDGTPARCVSHLVYPLLSDIGRAYRDAAVAARRPASKGFWDGNQAAQVKTNIGAHSDVKFMLCFEGYNPGANAPVVSRIVGHASRMTGDVGDMERFGWPAGWDSKVSTSLNRGLSHVTQYVSSDGFVCVELAAKSLSQIGFAVSAFVLCPGFGAATEVGVGVYHCDARL